MDRTLFTTLMAFSFALLLIYLLFTIFAPFLTALTWALAIGVITYPLYERLLKRCNGREMAAAGLMTLAIVLALVIPLVGLIFTLTQEAALAYQYLESATAGTHLPALENILRHPSLAPLMKTVRPLTSALNLELDSMLLPAVKRILSELLGYSSGILKDFLGFLIKLILMLISLFFIYKDGKSFITRFWSVITIGEKLKAAVCETIARVLKAVMYGIGLTCLVQGTLGGLGFWGAGLPSPILFGAMMAVCALVPLVGTALVWLPGALYLLMQGEILKGVLLIIWGLVVVSSIDNIIKPLFISGKAKLPILLISLGVLGGILAFGITGVVAGPVILALCTVIFEAGLKETVTAEKGE